MDEYLKLDLGSTSSSPSPSPPSSSFKLTPNVYTFSALISVCSRLPASHSPSPASLSLSLLNTMQTSPFYISPNLVVYSTAIYSCLKTSNSSLAFSLLDQVESNLSNLTSSSSSSSSDSDSISIIYNTVMATQSDPEAVSAVFARMKSLNIPRNLISYSTAMTAKEKNRDYVGVVELASEAERDSIKMDGVMYSTAIHASRELGDTNRVLQLFDDFKVSL